MCIYIYIYIYVNTRATSFAPPRVQRPPRGTVVARYRGTLYYSTPREESFTILLPERNPLLFYSQRGILYYSTPREESFTILLPEIGTV